jgi:hypothetical protein
MKGHLDRARNKNAENHEIARPRGGKFVNSIAPATILPNAITNTTNKLPYAIITSNTTITIQSALATVTHNHNNTRPFQG